MHDYNFTAGPAAIPCEVIAETKAALANWHDTGCSVLSVSHQSDVFKAMYKTMQQDLRDLMQIPDNYEVLFLHGGASAQFSMLPLNLLGDKTSADYVDTGHWSQKAIFYAQRFCNVNVIAKDESAALNLDWPYHKDSAYLHCTLNETIQGIKISNEVAAKVSIPVVADLSSCILSEPIDVSKYGVLYAGAQKNIGPSGLTIVIVRKDLLGKAKEFAPVEYDYLAHAKKESLLNTPTTFAWYIAHRSLVWLKNQGGVSAIYKTNLAKAKLLYAAIDSSDLYTNNVNPKCRSIMNVPFFLATKELTEKFLLKAEASGLHGLKGHRSVGGIRASIYNAMPLEGVKALVNFMEQFRR